MHKRKKLSDDRFKPFNKIYQRIKPKEILKAVKDWYNREDVVYYIPAINTATPYKLHQDICTKLGIFQEISDYNGLGMNMDKEFIHFARDNMYENTGKYNAYTIMDCALNYVSDILGEKNLESIMKQNRSRK